MRDTRGIADDASVAESRSCVDGGGICGLECGEICVERTELYVGFIRIGAVGRQQFNEVVK